MCEGSWRRDVFFIVSGVGGWQVIKITEHRKGVFLPTSIARCPEPAGGGASDEEPWGGSGWKMLSQ